MLGYCVNKNLYITWKVLRLYNVRIYQHCTSLLHEVHGNIRLRNTSQFNVCKVNIVLVMDKLRTITFWRSCVQDWHNYRTMDTIHFADFARNVYTVYVRR